MRYTRALINKKNLIHNLKTIRNIAPNSKVMAIVKANAYGHGIVECSRILEEQGVECLGVAYPEEGIKLRENGIKADITVLVPSPPEDCQAIVRYGLQSVVTSVQCMSNMNEAAAAAGKTAKLHLFIDSGMNREGILPEDAEDFMKKSREMEHVEIIAICTHFATADDPDPTFISRQLSEFNKTYDNLSGKGFSFKYRHTSNSAAVLNYPEAQYEMIRPGIFLYGYKSSRLIVKDIDLKPVMSFKSNVFKVKRLSKGDSVSYGRRFVAESETTIAVVPAGYGDGIFWNLTGQGKCLINGKPYNIVGAVCMDQIIVDVLDDDVKIGDEVVLIGRSGNYFIGANDIADQLRTIPYEITTSVTARVPRVVI